MLQDSLNDTIAAISTPIGEGGIGIVRLSGTKALAVADKVFSGKDAQKPSGFNSYSAHYGKIVNAGRVIDEVILTVMRSPKSYTREDVVEINCHAGIVALRQVLELVLARGCRLAEPGEFTKRAFLNGRIDLAQAEAVIDVIRAKTDSALQLGLAQLKGRLSEEIQRIRCSLLDALSFLEAQIDFPEDENPAAAKKKIYGKISSARLLLQELILSSHTARVLRQGIHVVICGRPNVGKSSLLNALLKKERSIVTALAGTTRDTIEEVIDIKGIPVCIVDTAGILKPRGLVEKKAVQRSKEQIKMADLALVIFDASKKLCAQDFTLIRELKNKKCIAVLNKIDLKQELEESELSSFFPRIVEISAKKLKNIELLEEAIAGFVYAGKLHSPESMLVSNLRHIRGLQEADKSAARALGSLKKGLCAECAAQELKESLEQLDVILGRNFSAELLERVFRDFCVGK